MKALDLGKRFVRDYFGYLRITQDMLNHRSDGLIGILSSYGYRVYVDVKNNRVFFGSHGSGRDSLTLLKSTPSLKAQRLGYELKLTRLFGIHYMEILGLRR